MLLITPTMIFIPCSTVILNGFYSSGRPVCDILLYASGCVGLRLAVSYMAFSLCVTPGIQPCLFCIIGIS